MSTERTRTENHRSHNSADERIISPLGIPTRIKSFGEKLFDWGTYGGVGFAANEVASVAIKEYGEKKGTWLNHWWKTTESYLENLFAPSLEKFSARFSNKSYFKIDHFWSAKNLSNTLIKNPLGIFILTLGGNLMVIPIRMLEAVKDPIVQKANEMWYGKEQANSEAMQDIRARMNAEPQQNWGTQIKSRIVTLFGAVGVYLAAGTPYAPSTWALNDTTLDRWASLDRIGTNVVRKLERAFHPERAHQVGIFDKISPYKILEEESKFANRGAKLFQVLTLSALFSFIFYLSTRVFARKQEEKTHKHMHAANNSPKESASPALAESLDEKTSTVTNNAWESKASDIPRASLEGIESHGRLQNITERTISAS